MKKPDMLCGY